VWQLGFGSGFKCNSAVWVARRRIRNMHPAWDGFNLQVCPGGGQAGARAAAGQSAPRAGRTARAGHALLALAQSTNREPPKTRQGMRDEFAEAEREKAAYLAAKAQAAAK
jgi:hypothetical protein